GALVHAEISRASVSRAFDAGMSASAITAAITRLSGGRENETLIWSIHEWEKQYTDVSLFEGITLTLSPERQYLAETDALKSLIYCSPARGVLILNTKNKEVVLDALQKCALDAVSAPQTEAAKERPRAAEPLFLHLPPDADTAFSPRAAAALPVPSSRQDAFDQRAARTRACTDMFLDALARLRLPPDRHNALKARIERRLIVSESQLRAAAGQVSGEKLEARALDYAGKANIAKAALEANETLEIQINGSEERMFVRPLSLEKTVDGAFLTAGPVSAAQNDMQECFSFPLGKIRYLRRIKKSSFL
ncbi:MAG: hypothetical protein LBC72_05865, partial [Spirochaetaceae bacterium]|nr:hypothetical protein [Spirochaetaceae bacterium]